MYKKNLSTCELYLEIKKQTKRLLIYFTCKNLAKSKSLVLDPYQQAPSLCAPNGAASQMRFFNNYLLVTRDSFEIHMRY